MATRKKAFTLEESWPKMRREVRLLSAIHEYPNNPRTHPPAQIALLSELLKKYGPDQDIVIDGDDDVILKGHGRHRAAILAGMKEFPCTIRYGMSEADKIAMRISDNAVSLLAGFDKELIRGEIVQLKALDYDVSLLGFGDAQLVQFTTLPGPPGQFPAVGENIPTSFQCPKCRYQWSGAPKPPPVKPKKPRAKKNGK
jgi:hypothetical protein